MLPTERNGAATSIGSEHLRRTELEALVGGPLKADEIRRVLCGSPNREGRPTFSVSARAGYFLRHFPEWAPKTPRARELYRHLADLTKEDASGRPMPLSITQKKLATYLGCSPRAVCAAVRELARTGVLPLLIARPGKQGRASRLLFVCDPFTVALKQEEEAARVRARRHAKAVEDQLRAYKAGAAGDITPARAAQLERAAQRRRDWNLPPRQRRIDRFAKRLAAGAGR